MKQSVVIVVKLLSIEIYIFARYGDIDSKHKAELQICISKWKGQKCDCPSKVKEVLKSEEDNDCMVVESSLSCASTKK